MDIKIQTKISVLLEKINYLHHSIIQNGDIVSKVDKDLLVNYVRELYELSLSIPIQNSNQYQPPYLPQQTPDFINPYQQQNYPPPNYPPANYPPNAGNTGTNQPQQPYIPPQYQQPQQQVPNKQINDFLGANIESKGIKTSGNGNGNGNGSSLNSSFNFSNGKRTLSENMQIKTGSEKQSVNEQFKKDERTEAAKKSMTPIKDLKTFIGLNKRFSYINFLFNNDANLYDEAIDKINSCTSINDAREYIHNLLRSKLKWDEKNEMVGEFNILIERRFLM